MERSFIGFEWVAACVAPGDIAPHPNFSVKQIRPVERLALIVQFQDAGYGRTRDRVVADSEPEYVDQFLRSAYESLMTATISDASGSLIGLGGDARLPFGMRVAAALLAAVAGGELDQLQPSMELLRELHDSSELEQAGHSASAVLTKAVLAQQIALRSLELGNVEAAISSSITAAQLLTDVTGDWEDFPLSTGVGWTAEESQARIADLVRRNAQGFTLAMRMAFDKSWADHIRATPPIADLRTSREVVDGLTSLVDEVFKEKYARITRSRTFRRGDPVAAPLYGALINAEMSGSLPRTRTTRELLGKTLAIRARSLAGEEHEGNAREALRLLRQAGAEEDLKRLIGDIRMQGDPGPLATSAVHLVDRWNVGEPVNSCDVLLISGAADLLPKEQQKSAMKQALALPENGRTGRLQQFRGPDWKKIEVALKAVSKILPQSELDEFAAQRVCEFARAYKVVHHQLSLPHLVNVAETLQWPNISEKVKENWENLIREIQPDDNVLPEDVIYLALALGEKPDSKYLNSLKGLSQVVGLHNGWYGKSADEAQVNKAISNCSRALERLLEEADNFTVTDRIYSPSQLAAWVVRKYGAIQLWPKLRDILKHSRVTIDEKINILQELSQGNVIPQEELSELRLMWPDRMPTGFEDPLFGGNQDRLTIAWIRFALEYDFAKPSDVRSNVIKFSSSHDAQLRRDVVILALRAAEMDDDNDWQIQTLLQLSHDANSSVKKAAVEALAYISQARTVRLDELVKDKVKSLLEEPGIGIVMGALQGLRNAARADTESRSLWCQTKVLSLLRNHPSRNVRHLANLTLQPDWPPRKS